jgi:hypothetical protein
LRRFKKAQTTLSRGRGMRQQSNGQGESELARGRRAVRWWQHNRVVHRHHKPPPPDPFQQVRVSFLEGVNMDAVVVGGIRERNLPSQLEWREAGDAGGKRMVF